MGRGETRILLISEDPRNLRESVAPLLPLKLFRISDLNGKAGNLFLHGYQVSHFMHGDAVTTQFAVLFALRKPGLECLKNN